MRYWKKIFALLVVLSTTLGASAEFRWGPTAGVNISNMHWKQKLIGSHTVAGPTVGVMGEIMIPGIGFGIDVGLRYQMTGAKVDFGEKEIWSSDGIGDQNVWLHTLQIPLNLRFKWTRMDGFEQYLAPFAYVGPVFSFNLASSDCPAIEHPAASVALQCGVGAEVIERLQVSFGYLWGVTYEARTVKLDNFSAQQRGWQINVAWLF